MLLMTFKIFYKISKNLTFFKSFYWKLLFFKIRYSYYEFDFYNKNNYKRIICIWTINENFSRKYKKTIKNKYIIAKN